jgi:Mlc titration factor MtfA (ptsG expression regulator)
VVFHEFAHKIDMLDGTVDGTPPISDAAERRHWIAVCTELYTRLRTGQPDILRDYAAVSPGEFFAVATEVFLTTPLELRHHEPDLYEILQRFYRQDPAARADRGLNRRA